jgi:hypothetical protein
VRRAVRTAARPLTQMFNQGALTKVFMKVFWLVTKKTFGIWFLLLACLVSAHAQDPKVSLERFDHLANKAEETIEVALDERLLQLAAKFLNSKDPAQAKIKEIIAGLKGVYVRVFKFSKQGEYDIKELDSLRGQLRAPGWQKIVGVRNTRGGDNVDVHLLMQNDNIAGLAIIAADSRELTLVNIVGMIDLEKLSQLQGQLGIPRFDFDFSSGKTKPRNEE